MSSKSKLSRRQMVAGAAVSVAALAGGAFGIVTYKDQTWAESAPYRRQGNGPAKAVVVCYSRSGHTLIAAKQVAGLLDAELVTIDAPKYPRTFSGQMQASDDADAQERETEITHDPLDLTAYDFVILCTPVWWFRPAVPMWTFVGKHDFAGRRVVLLMTGNSRYESSMLDEFKALVASQNGRFTGSSFIERGRIFWQISKSELERRARDVVSSHSLLERS